MAYTYMDQPWSGRRLAGLAGAIAVNVALIAAISGGLNFDIDKIIPPKPLQVVTIETVIPTEPVKVPEPAVEQRQPEIDLPPPVVEIPLEPVKTPLTVQTEPSPPQVITPATELQADSSHPLTPPIYPPQSVRRNEQGTVTLLIYVMDDGRVGDVRVKKSSGFPLLDEAAMKAARKDWRFEPATQGGSAVAAWGLYSVAFELKDQE